MNEQVTLCLRLFVPLLLLFITPTKSVLGQSSVDNYWLFGNGAEGIYFGPGGDQPDALPFDMPTPYGTGGGAVAVDPITRDLLFFTDGAAIYDREGNQMPGSALGGNPAANQAAVIIPLPGNSNQYYVIANSANGVAPGTLRYAIVDMSINAPFGAVVSAPADLSTLVLGLPQSTEAMTVVPGDAPEEYYLVFQVGGGTSTFAEVNFDAGISAINTFNLATSGYAANVASNINYSSATGQLVVSSTTGGVNIQLLNFDNAVGNISFDRQLPNTSNTDGGEDATYEAVFSPSGQYVYYTRFGGGLASGELLRVDLTVPGATPETVLSFLPAQSYGLKVGGDGALYHLYETATGEVEMGRVVNPDEPAGSLVYEQNPLGVADYAGRGFSESSYPHLFATAPNFTFRDVCLQNNTKFYPDLDEPAQDVTWVVTDPALSAPDSVVVVLDEFAPIYTFAAPGIYDVYMVANVAGVPDTTRTQVVIEDNTFQSTLFPDTTICAGTSVDLPAGPGADTYEWSTGETSETITVSEAGLYWVTATAGACTTYAQVQVQIYDQPIQNGNFWQFGNGAGIDFNQQPPVGIASSVNAPEGVATVSDANGETVFYTDGSSVFTGGDGAMVGGTNIGGEPGATQSAVIMAYPNEESYYYIFTTEEVYGAQTYQMKYSIVDMRQNAPNGEVVVSDRLVFRNSTERLAGFGNDGGWILAHEYGNNIFRAYPITAAGIGEPVISPIGSVHSFSEASQGQGMMRLSPDGTRLAVVLNEGGNPRVELFDFDPGSGEVSNLRTLPVPDTGSPLYGLEFSSGGTKLYASTSGGTSQIYQWELDQEVLTTEGTTIPASRHLLASEAVTFGALQNGPDGQIYVAVNGSSSLATISAPDLPEDAAGFTLNGFALAGGTTSSLGLPNFISSFFTGPAAAAITTSSNCADAPITLTATGTSSFDDFLWTFTGPESVASSTEQNPIVTIGTPGTYTVNVDVSNVCAGVVASLTADLEVFAAPPTPTLPATASICTGPINITALSPDDATLTYAWQDSVFTNTRVADVPGIYSVTLTNVNGCTSQGTVNVLTGTPTVDLGPDRLVCQNTEEPALNAGNLGSTYAWTINGAPSVTTQTQPVDTSVPGVFTYAVTVTNALTGCQATDEVVLTIGVAPDFSLTTANPQTSGGCTVGTATHSIANNGPAGTYLVSWTDQQGALAFQALSPAGNDLTAPAGIYTATIQDQANLCESQVTGVVIEDPTSIAPTATTSIACDEQTGTVQLALNLPGPPPGGIQYRLSLSEPGGTEIFSFSPVTQENETIAITNVPAGTYNASLLNTNFLSPENNCLTPLADLTFATDPEIDLTVDPLTVVCGSDAELVASSAAAARFTFMVPGASVPNPFVVPNEVTASSGQGTTFVRRSYDNLEVTAIPPVGSGTCPTTETVEVLVSDLPTVTIQQTGDPCEGSITLNAVATQTDDSPGSNFSYLWSEGSVGETLVINQPSTGIYNVQVVNNDTGCTNTSNDRSAPVYEPFTVTTSGQASCADGTAATIRTSVSQPGDYSYLWTAESGLFISINNRDSLSIVPAGNYTVEVTAENGCEATSTFELVRLPIDVPTLPSGPLVICTSAIAAEENSVELDPGTPAEPSATVLWENLATGTTSTNATFVATEPGFVRVTFNNDFGCAAADSVLIREVCVPEVFAPTAFNPNSTVSQNRAFRVFSQGVGEFEITIFNRWGEIVYYSQDVDFEWDGTAPNGAPAPIGTYSYTIRFQSETNPELGFTESSGGVTLLK